MGEWDISHLSLPACKARWASLDPVYLQHLTWRRKAAETSTKTPFIPAVDYFHSCSQEGGPGVSGPALTPVPDTWTVTQPDHIHMKQPWTVTQCSCLLAVITFPSANTPHMKLMSSLEDAFILKLAQSTAAPILYLHANIFYCFTYLVILFSEMTKTFQGVKDFTFRCDLKPPTAHPESFIQSEHAAVSQPVAFSSLPNSRHCSFRPKQSCYCVQHQIKHSVPTYASSHPDSPASWLVKQLGRWAAMGKRRGGKHLAGQQQGGEQ